MRVVEVDTDEPPKGYIFGFCFAKIEKVFDILDLNDWNKKLTGK